MQKADIPVKFPIPFGNSAGGSFIQQVPTDSQIGITDGAASLTTGFPPLNFDPVEAGGVPPYGKDVNGIHYQSTSWDRWFSAGGPVEYDAAFSAEIGGYPEGAVVQSATTLGLFWISSADDNVTDPDAGGAGWLAFTFDTHVNGQCVVEYVSNSTYRIMPKDGNAVCIGGVSYKIPAAGITVNVASCYVGGVAAQALVNLTAYNIFLRVVSGSLVPDHWNSALATGGRVASSTDGNVGVQVRNNNGTPDNTRSLVGKIALNGSGAVFTLGLLSWFNKQPIYGQSPTATAPAFTNAVMAEINSSGRQVFITWGGVQLSVASSTTNTAIAVMATQGIVTDLVNIGTVGTTQKVPVANNLASWFSNGNLSAAQVPEGMHTVTQYAQTDGGSMNISAYTDIIIYG